MFSAIRLRSSTIQIQAPPKAESLNHTPIPRVNNPSHKLIDGEMASLFHRLEQLVERENQGWFDRLLSRNYSVLSNYGSSSLRPLIYFMLLFFATFIIIFANDGAGYGNAADFLGWQTGLVGGGCGARAERALTLAGQATLNPLGVFGTKGLLVAKYGWLETWLTLHGVLSALFLALFIFAARRRFKIT
jgi:hypothetical protein